jgi:hypothetical protein
LLDSIQEVSFQLEFVETFKNVRKRISWRSWDCRGKRERERGREMKRKREIGL